MAQNKNEKELSPAASINVVKKLLKQERKQLKVADFQPGAILMYRYDAKDKTQTYDKTPLVFVLRRNRKHTLCINFHWAPTPLRVVLVKKILYAPGNRKRMRKGEPLVFDYGQLKPFLKRIGFAPIIRKYINRRISRTGVVVPQDQLMNVARTKSETFTEGKVSAEKLYRLALKRNKQYRKTRKRRE
jgi:hypothetical protein